MYIIYPLNKKGIFYNGSPVVTAITVQYAQQLCDMLNGKTTTPSTIEVKKGSIYLKGHTIAGITERYLQQVTDDLFKNAPVEKKGVNTNITAKIITKPINKQKQTQAQSAEPIITIQENTQQIVIETIDLDEPVVSNIVPQEERDEIYATEAQEIEPYVRNTADIVIDDQTESTETQSVTKVTKAKKKRKKR